MMKKIVCSLVFILLAWAGSVFAQVTVEVGMEQDQFLPGESVPVRARVINHSGQTLHFGQEEWLTYSIESVSGVIAARSGKVPIAHDFDVRASEWAATHADLGPYFNINKPGRYAVIATVSIAAWSNSVSSVPTYFDIVPGNKVWEQEFGVPHSSTNQGQPEFRKYILQEATFAARTKMYLRLTDATESRTYRLFPVGPMISFSDPQVFVDRSSFLHLLYQENAHVYSYTVTNPDGELVVRQTYQYVNSAPKLRVDETGMPKIVGGVRHLSSTDLPRPQKSASTNDFSLPSP